MASVIIVELMAKGILAAVGHYYDDTSDAIEAVKHEITSMKGILETFSRGMDEEMSHLNGRLDDIFDAVQRLEYKQIRENMINTMDSVPDASVRERVLKVSMALYSLIHNTEIEEVSIQVNKTIAPASSSYDQYAETLVDTITVSVNAMTSAAQISQKVMELNKEGIGTFSMVHHQNEDPLHVVVNAASREDAEKEELIIATGALYMLCQILCATIQDPRGVYSTATDDGVFARSANKPFDNACHISLRYYWPSPLQFRRIEDFVNNQNDDPDGESKFLPVIEVLERKKSDLRIRNVYLLGETGEGKSTLGNVLTGTEEFFVSDAGTGTVRISGTLATERGLLGGGKEIMVWDTPGMNDQQGRDRIYEGMLQHHLTRENTVSTIIIVSKDGSRIPSTLINTLEVYRRAFGDAFTSTICVVIGMNQKRMKPKKIADKLSFWAGTLCSILRIPTGSLDDKILFYNAEDDDPQPSAERLKHLIFTSQVHLTGTGVAILQGLQKLRKAQLKDEEKRAMFRASENEFEAIRNEVREVSYVKFKIFVNHDNELSSMSMALLPTLGATIKAYFRYHVLRKENREEEKVIIFNCVGQRAKRLLSKRFLVNHEIYHGSKIDFIIRYARENKLLLSNVGSETRRARRGKIQVQTYNLLHLEDRLDSRVFDEADEILRLITIHPNYAATFGSFIPKEQ